MKYFNSLVILLLLFVQLSLSSQSLNKLKSSKLQSSNFIEKLDFTFKNNVIILTDVKVVGSDEKFNFILDSGSEYSFISKDIARKIKFQPHLSEEITDGFENKGIALGLMNFQLGSVLFNDVGVSIMENNPIMDKICNIDGYIGYNLMKSCVWQLGLDEIIITDKIKNMKELGSYHKQKLYDGPTVEAGFTNGFNSTMLFDLGDNGTIEIQESRMDLIKEKEITTGVGQLYTTGLGMGNRSNTSVHNLIEVPEFNLGKHAITDMVVYTANSPTLPIDAIGAGILNYYKIILDFPKKRFFSLNINDKYIDPGFRTHGLKYEIVENKVIVSFVWNNSPAYKSGIRVGQQVVKIDEIYINDLLSLNQCAIQEYLRETLEKEEITLLLFETNSFITLNKDRLFNTK